MSSSDNTKKRNPRPRQNRDEFVAAIPWGNSRTVLVHRRVWGGREYVRLRTWNRHVKKNVWYPTKRGYVIPIAEAEDLADAIYVGASGNPVGTKPAWLIAREEEEDDALKRLENMDVSAETIEAEKKRVRQARRRRA